MERKLFINVLVLAILFTLLSMCLCEEEQLGDTTSTESVSVVYTTNAAVTQNGFWLTNLLWNVLGYATLVVPFAILIRMVKQSNFKERGGKWIYERLY